MIDSLTSANHRDFGARYKGTWGYYLADSGNKLLVKVHEVSQKEVKFADIDGSIYTGFADMGLKFEFIPVNKGFFNGDKCVYWFERIPARQWQRGISANNTHVSFFDGNFAKANIEKAVDVVFNPQKSTLGVYESWRFYCDGKRSAVALSKHFALGDGMVFFYKQNIGTITDHTITLTQDVVAQELRDVIARNGLNIEVRT